MEVCRGGVKIICFSYYDVLYLQRHRFTFRVIKEKKYHYVYRIRNIRNKMQYVGVHSTDNLDDGYMGSGTYLKNARKKYGLDSFVKEIIKTFDNRDEALAYESQIVNEDFVRRKSVYNLVLGGGQPKMRNLTLSKFIKSTQLTLVFDKRETTQYFIDIPEDQRLVFYPNVDVINSMRRHLDTSKTDDALSRIRNKLRCLILDNVDAFCETLTMCYNDKKHNKLAKGYLRTLHESGWIETIIIDKYSMAA